VCLYPCISPFSLDHLKVLWDSPSQYSLLFKTFVLELLFKALPLSLRVPIPCDHLRHQIPHARCTLRPWTLTKQLLTAVVDWSRQWLKVWLHVVLYSCMGLDMLDISIRLAGSPSAYLGNPSVMWFVCKPNTYAIITASWWVVRDWSAMATILGGHKPGTPLFRLSSKTCHIS